MIKRILFLFAAVLFSLTLSPHVQAQWLDGKMAIRTNGNSFQSGDRLKIELLPLDLINERFYTQVSYNYSETVQETDKDGKVVDKQVGKKISRRPSPIMESLKAFQFITIDDSFFFGDASPEGRYDVDVRVFQASSDRVLLKLSSCVFFQSSSEGQECDTFLRAVKTVHHEMFFTFEGKFNPRGYYSVIFLNKENVVRHIAAGAFTDGNRILNLSSDKLDGLAGQTLDILILDQYSGNSSTLRATIASVK